MQVSRESPPWQFLASGSAMSGPQRYQHGFCRYVQLFVVYQAMECVMPEPEVISESR